MARRVASIFVALGMLANIPTASGQGCAMCYTAASAAGKAAARALDSGILILLIPTLVMFVGVLVFAVRRANSAG